MPTYVEALDTILNNIKTLDIEDKVLGRALGQVLAEDVYSNYDLPMRDTSGPDGYAVKAKDIQKARRNNPVTLEVIGTLGAGYLSPIPVLPGTAIRTMTGSVIPEGADCVVRFEDTDEPGNKSGPNLNNPTRVKIYVSQAPGTNINKSGGQIRKGSLLMARNAIIGPPQLSALTAIGRRSVKVIRRPRVAIITTGDELIKAGIPLSPGKTYNCNEIALRSLVLHYGGVPWVLGIARDKERELTLKMQKGLVADAIITTGGVSKGDYDLVRLVIGKMGKLLFNRVELRPGAAFAFGLAKKSSTNMIPIFALSGPPSGCIVNFETIVRPALLKMRGLQELRHPAVEAIIEGSAANNSPIDTVTWTDLQRIEGGYRIKQHNQAGLLADMSAANSFTIIPGGTEIKAGREISVWPLDWAR